MDDKPLETYIKSLTTHIESSDEFVTDTITPPPSVVLEYVKQYGLLSAVCVSGLSSTVQQALDSIIKGLTISFVPDKSPYHNSACLIFYSAVLKDAIN